jgi:hypothetical protein
VERDECAACDEREKSSRNALTTGVFCCREKKKKKPRKRIVKSRQRYWNAKKRENETVGKTAAPVRITRGLVLHVRSSRKRV